MEVIKKTVNTRVTFIVDVSLTQVTEDNPQWPPVYDNQGHSFLQKAESIIRKMHKDRGISGRFETSYIVLGNAGEHFMRYENVHIKNEAV